jgi:hypothetical protein
MLTLQIGLPVMGLSSYASNMRISSFHRPKTETKGYTVARDSTAKDKGNGITSVKLEGVRGRNTLVKNLAAVRVKGDYTRHGISGSQGDR